MIEIEGIDEFFNSVDMPEEELEILQQIGLLRSLIDNLMEEEQMLLEQLSMMGETIQ